MKEGKLLPEIVTEIPGPESRRWIEDLSKTECPAITARRSRRKEQGGVDQDPIVWESGKGANICDVDGNIYVDLTSAFGVCGIGHSHPMVAGAAADQAQKLIHGMGDVYPGRTKIELSRKLSSLLPEGLEMSIFASSGAEAVEVAIKTAVIATGKNAVVAFHGGYHGLSLGALGVTGYKEDFKRPFRSQIADFARYIPYPNCYRCHLDLEVETCGMACLESGLSSLDNVAAVIVEPIQGRGGVVVPPKGWLASLSEECSRRGILLILDEIYTGFGRSGAWFACEHEGVIPDLICVGKALGGGFPLSAVIGKSEVMNKWGLSGGESLHTSTFLGNPLGCRMALESLKVLQEEALVERVLVLEGLISEGLNGLYSRHDSIGDVRGRGAMFGVELVVSRSTREPNPVLALAVTRKLLERGFLVLPSGVDGNVISVVPPFVITEEQLEAFFTAFDQVLSGLGGEP